MPAVEAILYGLASRAIWEALRLGLKALRGGELQKLHIIFDNSITEISRGDRALEETIRGMFEDSSISSEMARYLATAEIDIQTLINAFKKTTYHRRTQIPDDKLNEIFSQLHKKIIEGIEQDKELRDRLTFAYVKETFGKVARIENYLLPDVLTRARHYLEYFNSIAKIRHEEFQRLGLYTEPYLETVLETQTGESKKALEIIKDIIKKHEPQMTFILGESGSGKTFTFLKVFEDLRDEFLRGNSKIPLFVELYRWRGGPIKKLITECEDIEESYFKQDANNYAIFLDGLNEAGDIHRCLDEIGRFSESCPQTKIFVSAQREEGPDRSRYPLYRIRPFRPEQIISYLSSNKDKFPTEEVAKEFYNGLDPILKTEVSRPLLLYMLAASYDGRTRPNNLGELFQRFEEFVCGERERPFPHIRSALDPLFRNRVIPFLAFKICEKGEPPPTINEIYDYLKEFKKSETEQFDSDGLIKKVTRDYWIASLRGDSFRFTHDLLRDYFAARYIKDKKMGINEVLGLIFKDGEINTTFASVAQLLCGIESEEKVKLLISRILQKDPYLAASCFAMSSTEDLALLKNIDIAVDINYPNYLYLDRLPQFYLRGLEFLKGKKGPEYASCQNSLGIAYGKLSEVRDKEDNIGLAIKCFNEALRVRTFEGFPQQYAMTQMNLGIAYWCLSAVRDKEANLGLAIECFKEALWVRTFEKFPQQYAMTQHNLGNAYLRLSEVRDKEDNLGLAIECFKKALWVRTFEKFPQDYAMTQMNLGNAYQGLSEVRDKETNLEQAIRAYNEALRVYTKEALPWYFVMTSGNLARALEMKGEITEAVRVMEEMLPVAEEVGHPRLEDYRRFYEALKSAR